MCSEDYWTWTLAENKKKTNFKGGVLDSENSAPNP